MEGKCFICDNLLSSDKIVLVNHGMKTLRQVSKERNDGNLKFIRKINSIEIHMRCRRNSIRKDTIATLVAKRERDDSGPSTSLIISMRTLPWTIMFQCQY